MNFIKFASVAALAGALVGCGGHGYEGEYQTKAGSSNEFMNAFAGSVGAQNLVIGSDYIESEGERHEFEEIFVRESGTDKYLVFKEEGSEEAWKILDEDTLMQGNGLMNIKLVRIK
ncbi:hypothetical protein [Vibrio nereis]|uniref:hypothetical protein n=1 Tax=Vibrio nereis TaxID=693 RepID=UPI000A8DF6C0|nr:hypothetical protein [Vibrio nereis]